MLGKSQSIFRLYNVIISSIIVYFSSTIDGQKDIYNKLTTTAKAVVSLFNINSANSRSTLLSL